MLNDKILKIFQDPHNAGDLPEATAVAEVSNPVCGDIMRLAVQVADGRILQARFKTHGCVAAIAAGSVLTDLLIEKTLEETQKIRAEDISAGLDGLPQASFHAAQLCVDAVAAVLQKLH
jgi:nitrogen fixation protein NifU and related proteins